MWLVNGVIAAGVLAWIFISGEPVTKSLSESSVVYWRNRKQADVELARVSSRGFRGPMLHTRNFACLEIYSISPYEKIN